MKKRTLNVGMIYSSIITAIAFLLMITGICLFLMFPTDTVLKVIMTIVFSLLAICNLLGFLFLLQTATLSEKGITFKCTFIKVVDIKWDEIKKIEISSLPTLESIGTKINFKWIIFYTDINQQPKDGGGNYWNKPPWQIKATKKNVAVIKSFLAEYCPKLNNKLD